MPPHGNFNRAVFRRSLAEAVKKAPKPSVKTSVKIPRANIHKIADALTEQGEHGRPQPLSPEKRELINDILSTGVLHGSRDILRAVSTATDGDPKALHSWLTAAQQLDKVMAKRGHKLFNGTLSNYCYATRYEIPTRIKEVLARDPKPRGLSQWVSEVKAEAKRAKVPPGTIQKITPLNVRTGLTLLEHMGNISRIAGERRMPSSELHKWGAPGAPDLNAAKNVHEMIMRALFSGPKTQAQLTVGTKLGTGMISSSLRQRLAPRGFVTRVRARQPNGRMAEVYSVTNPGRQAVLSGSFTANITEKPVHPDADIAPVIQDMARRVRLRVLHDQLPRGESGMVKLGAGDAFERTHGVNRVQRRYITRWEHTPINKFNPQQLERFFAKFDSYAPGESKWLRAHMGFGVAKPSEAEQQAHAAQILQAIKKENWNGRKTVMPQSPGQAPPSGEHKSGAIRGKPNGATVPPSTNPEVLKAMQLRKLTERRDELRTQIQKTRDRLRGWSEAKGSPDSTNVIYSRLRMGAVKNKLTRLIEEHTDLVAEIDAAQGIKK